MPGVARWLFLGGLVDSTTNALHRKILINYRRHGLLEASGRYDELLAPEMTVRHPYYRIFEGGEGVILDGMDQVRSFYKMLADMDMLVMWTGKQKISVGDYGFSGEAEFSQFVPGKILGDNVFSPLTDDDEKTAESAYDRILLPRPPDTGVLLALRRDREDDR